ncbi:MAG: tRNA uridine-5-carboxymethylaminomethyl(34) synthesis GTPase MnmE [Ruminococcaceae bacterium]|nr:tRNA uridine-5-carboxymethylaminomethyl(34) synthesis GTPase MnmE [Oscillospiraceae bacterium]
MKFFDTIAAIATPLGNGGIAIIRISGEESVCFVEKIAFPLSGKALSAVESHKMTLCQIRGKNNHLIDEALVVSMLAPKSYTGENIVEIHCHGGAMAARLIMDELSDMGIRQAEPGEFTRRAFINGKIDLAGAEAVMDMIDAKSRLGVYDAASSLSGKLGEKISSLRNRVLALAARLSATADFPDEIDEIEDEEFLIEINGIKKETNTLIESFEKGRFVREGVLTAIVGRPNVGKSSLLNALLKEDRAIVTDIPGTTRDTLSEYINIGGLALILRDTAGIRESSDVVEKIGIERAKDSIKEADLVLFVLDSSEAFSPEDMEIAENLKDKNVLIVLNKQDKNTVLTVPEISEKTGVCSDDIIPLALPKDGEKIGISQLENRICHKFVSTPSSGEEIRISNRRHRDCLVSAREALKNLENGLTAGMPKDLLYIDLEDAATGLGEITGETVQEEIVNQVFEKFCVGK